MRAIFLDIDGVLNSWRFFKDGHSNETLFSDPSSQIDHRAVAHLNDLVERSGATVVIPSTWRLLHSLHEITEWLRAKGFRGAVLGATPHITRGVEQIRRGEEISAFLAANPQVTDFVILDDNDDMAPHMQRLILVDARKGLKPTHITLALEQFWPSEE